MVKCDVGGCKQGWVRGPRGWADKCPFCLGAGQVSFDHIACRIGECEDSIRRLYRGKLKRASTCARICAKLCELLDPPKPKQMELEDAMKTFGSSIDLFASSDPPKGVDFVATTLEAPGPLLVSGCPIHGMGCPSNCPVLKAYEEYEKNPPPPCRPVKR